VAVALDGQTLLDWAPLVISAVALLASIGAVLFPFWRRPSLSLHDDPERTHSRVEGDGLPYLRLLVRNAKGKRSGKQARVVLDGYRPAESTGPLTRLGSPFLGWPSAFGQDSDSYISVVFSDAARPVGLGRFARVRVNPDERLEREERYRQDLSTPPPGPIRHFPDAQAAPDARWHLHLELADAAAITDERDWLEPGSWTVRLIVGADDGDAHAYEVDVAWIGDESDAEAVLKAALDSLKVRRDRG
jgi:hypothetical protein